MEKLTSCPLCENQSFTPYLAVADHSISHERFTLEQCVACGFVATNPRPTPDEIARYYDSPDYISHSNTHQGLQAKLYQWVRRHALQSKHRAIAKHYTSGRILDYGCGTGEFLAHMKAAGYETVGIEPSTAARAQALANHQIQAYSRIEQLPQDHYEVITLWHVMEHIHNLSVVAMQLSEKLVAGGLLVIAVPDRESWDASYYGADWAAYDVPRHLWHFRRQDVKRLLERMRVQLLHVSPMWFDAPYIAIHSERYRGAGASAALVKGALVGGWSNLVAASTSRPTSSSLFFARKP